MAKGRKTGGRLKGTPNKATAAVKSFVAGVEARLHQRGMSLEERAFQLLRCADPQVIARTLGIILAYKYGKPVQPIAGAGEDSEPVKIVFDSIPRPRRAAKSKEE